MKKNRIKGSIYGFIVGDALGVPVEFCSRSTLRIEPLEGMLSYGTHDQPKGTWSDDTSLMLCLLDAIGDELDLIDISKKMISWMDNSSYTANGEVFDIGFTTRNSLIYLKNAIQNNLKIPRYSIDEKQNGNGSLMRILPLLFYFKNSKKKEEDNFDLINDISALTHGHIRSSISCLIYLIFCNELTNQLTKSEAYSKLKKRMKGFFNKNQNFSNERVHFDRILNHDITKLNEDSIKSSGYVIHSLECSIWSFLTTSSYKNAVLKAINLGEDTDTNGAITGSLAGLFYGFDSIPNNWTRCLQNKSLIETIVKNMNRI